MSTIEATRPPDRRSPAHRRAVAARAYAPERSDSRPSWPNRSRVISPTMTAVLIIPLCFADAGQGTWLAYAFGT